MLMAFHKFDTSKLTKKEVIYQLTHISEEVGGSLLYSDLTKAQQKNKDIAFAYLTTGGVTTQYYYKATAFKNLPKELQEDKDFVLKCVKARPELFFQLPETLKKDADIAQYEPEQTEEVEIKP